MNLLAGIDADEATVHALLNCLVREVSEPERQVRVLDGRAEIRLARLGITLRAGLTHRLEPPFEELGADGPRPLRHDRLADLVAGELELSTGHPNPEFTAQVSAGHAALAAIIDHRDDPGALGFLAAERSLVAGHRFHPAPKTRQGDPAGWLRYAPETGAVFPLRWLAVREDLVAQEGDLSALDALAPPAPRGFAALPVHPWQHDLLAPGLRPALASGVLRDLGTSVEAAATSSVRTVLAGDVFLKFSLDTRITNCVRKNAWYELAGSVALTRLLAPAAADLTARFGCRLLPEPGYRTAALADRALYEGLGVIVREGTGLGSALLAGALADPYGCGPAAAGRLLGGCSPEHLLAWWTRYAELAVPPVLHAFEAYGVVLEPHLQNVLMEVDADGLPARAIFRDLEGTKLVAGRWDLGALPARVRESLTYTPEQGWNRVVYCLFVNHLTELAAALLDLHPGLPVWPAVRRVIERYAAAHLPTGSPRLRALLAGVPLPAKANLRTRWARTPDRTATYVPIPSPFADPS